MNSNLSEKSKQIGQHGFAVFSTPGSYTWTIPDHIAFFKVSVTGGGGSGWRPGDAGGLAYCGGGAGVTIKFFTDATPGTVCNLTVGKGGNGGASPQNGETSTFEYDGTIISGGRGRYGTPTAGGTSGVGINGDIIYSLGAGDYYRGGGPGGGCEGQNNAVAPGAGAHPERYDGGKGGDGIIIIEW